MKAFLAIAVLIHCQVVYGEGLNDRTFPTDFQFGVATAAYQIEGAWNLSGKGENIWDRLCHSNPTHIRDGTNGDIACDSYHKYKEDVQLIKNLGVKFYRFSLSWSRILPTGYTNHINEDGIRYYNALIDELIANGIEPVVTIFHWDLPQPLQEIGGWPNKALVRHFGNFARIAYREFGTKVKTWITINEPLQICKMAYGDGILAPAFTSSGTADYKCSYTVLLAHAEAYRIYEREFKTAQNGKCGITVSSTFYEPLPDNEVNRRAADRMWEFDTGIYMDPIFSASGDWPAVLKQTIADASALQGYPSSRLPDFSPEEIEMLKGSSDFFGLNHYTTRYVTELPNHDPMVVSWDNDARVYGFYDETWQTGKSTWLKVVPWGLRETLKKIKALYGDVDIMITENGYSDDGDLNDYDRANYYITYLSACLDAIYEDNVKLIAYTAWSLLDNFEWVNGYSHRFGLHHVDFEDPERPRTAKLSAGVFKQIVADRKLPNVTIEVPITTEQPTTTGEPDSGIVCVPAMLSILIAAIAVLFV